ncbi:MAG: uroporphyrinogen decarboxylase [Candidatus Pelagibacter sp.]
MSPLQKCIFNKDKSIKPIWLMRQAGRYLPEFRKIRQKNKNFVSLCLDKKLVPKITLQPIKRFNFDAAIIFSDILMVPYGLGQKLKFTKGYGPELGDFNKDLIFSNNKNDFENKLNPIYESIKITSNNNLLKNKDLIGFIGAPWTLLVYIINKKSPKRNIKKNFFLKANNLDRILNLLKEFLKVHIINQVKSGATVIQIFDSWAGLLEEKDLEKYVYQPTKEIVEFTKKLNIPIICFPRNIKNYKKYVSRVNPDAINIDSNVDPLQIIKDITIPVQGGLDPKLLLGNKDTLKKSVQKYKNIFKDHPYIFNLGHGVLPETNPDMVKYLIEFIKDN